MGMRGKISLISKKIVLLGVFILSTFIMIMFDDYSAQFPLKMLIIIFTLDFLQFHISAKLVSIKLRKANENTVLDQRTCINLLFNNRLVFPFKKMIIQVRVHNRYIEKDRIFDVNLNLRCKRKQTLAINIDNNCVGKTEIFFNKIYLIDAFGLFSSKVKAKYNTDYVVMPYKQDVSIDINSISEVVFDSAYINYVHIDKLPDDKYQIREFRDGDKLNAIHWKLSSKSDELIVRDSESTSKIDMYVYVNLSKDVDINKEMVKAISLCYELINSHKSIYLLWLDGENQTYERRLIDNQKQIDECIYDILHYNLYDQTDLSIKEIQKIIKSDNNTIFRMHIDV